MALFTFLMEFEGGTYLSQVRASSPDAALKKWVRGLEVKEIEGMTAKMKRQLVDWLPEAKPVPVEGLKATWCSGFLADSKAALVHFFRTAER